MIWWGLIVFSLALIGYSGTLRYLGINPYLSWITAIMVEIILLYISAMLKILEIGYFVVVILGLLLFVGRLIFTFLGKGRLQFEGIHLFDIWMLALGIAMAVVLFHSSLIHYDNFSHWAIIVKFLHFEARLPGAADTIISFTSYPPATSLFVALFTKLVGFSDGSMLVGQFLIIWAALYSLFATLRDRTRGLMSTVMCLIIALSFIFNIAIRLNNLLVDYVLPVLTIAALVGIFVYRLQPKLLCAHTALFVGGLLLVKNSAIFFVVIILGYFLYTLFKVNNDKRWQSTVAVIGTFLGTTMISFLPFIWWGIHVHRTFKVSKHEISLKMYQHQFATEGSDHILKIGHKMLAALSNIQSLSVQGVLLVNLVLFISWLLIYKGLRHKNSLLKIMFGLDVIFLVYVFSLFGMYIFSMPYAEAINLDGYERYMSSIVVLNLFIAGIFLVRVMDQALYEQRFEKRNLRSFKSLFSKNLYQMSTFIVLIFSIIAMLSEINGTQFTNRFSGNQLPQQMKAIAQPTTKLNKAKILVVDPHPIDVADYYAGYVGKYYFFSDKVVAQENFMESPAQFQNNVQRYQYVAIPEYHHTFTVMTRKVYRQHIKIGLFKVTPQGLQRITKVEPSN
ncbi:glycosyltransferase family 39 protein [Lapidilactobacillus wuchangensis]|uniref:glycosyltransferase family 39 protein n=1 Tax=Lapidilactobacillus wuchangensis TaxID=2486001 RepID=UPI000F76C8DE|nr:glycosyltransferase family 39 protein [Lapidilactobacillus wuchangensis]